MWICGDHFLRLSLVHWWSCRFAGASTSSVVDVLPWLFGAVAVMVRVCSALLPCTAGLVLFLALFPSFAGFSFVLLGTWFLCIFHVACSGVII